MASVRPGRDGIVVELERAELELLGRLADGLAERLRAGGDDRVVDRLAPAASMADADADHELRRMLRSELLDGRAERLTRLRAELRRWAEATPGAARTSVTLEREVAMELVQGLNDLRLALGAQIDVASIERSELAVDDPRALTLALMDRLGGLQHGLIELLDGP